MVSYSKMSVFIAVLCCVFAFHGCNKDTVEESPPPPAEPAEATEEETPKKPEPGTVADQDVESAGRYEDPVLKIIHQRKSVRKYLPKPVSKVQLEKLVRAGMAAPTARNRQPWAFMVITERETLDKLGSKLPHAKMIFQTPAAIVAAGDMNLAIEGAGREFWIQDVSAAIQNILLAAEAMGLGAVWTGVYPMENQLKIVNETLSLPEHIIPLAVIPVGVPAGVEEPKDKWDPEKLHWEEWGRKEQPSLVSTDASPSP